ncbi:cytochrome P450 [Kitasatospora sp. MAA4]|uniref:hypothetical protein n=1 Tax=Kitasatospora sp. MAA4 TaxID=3035093 RepID=UPI002474690A|nr:hypothetical protein [Kitasatospora sp. MAA4]MDH6131759.1 cytochrome P450 [Kitasatospora sp. MAA4]
MFSAQLARLQAEVVFGRLLESFPDACAAEPATRHPGLGNRGFSRMPVTLLS